MKTRVHLRDRFIRSFIEREPTVHLLAVEQREDISVERVAELYAVVVHGDYIAEEGADVAQKSDPWAPAPSA